MGDITLSNCSMGYSVLLHVERGQIFWKGKLEKKSDEVTKTKFVKLWDWLAYQKEQDEKCSLVNPLSPSIHIQILQTFPYIYLKN